MWKNERMRYKVGKRYLGKKVWNAIGKALKIDVQLALRGCVTWRWVSKLTAKKRRG